jgi:uncharacterized YccA/Bax inhibitor family protein
MRTSNPTLNDSVFEKARLAGTGTGVMTLNGTVIRTAILALLLLSAASWSWKFASGELAAPEWLGAAMKIGWLVPLGVALVISFVPTTAPLLAPVYAVTKGLLLGVISAWFESAFSGIVLTAVLLTCGILVALLAVYLTGLIKPSENFKLGVAAATFGVFLFYIASWVLAMFGVQVPGIFGSGWVGIAFSGFVVVLASLNLVLDFDFIENGVESGAPKHMEWYAAFGLLVTLVWLYIEILRLLAKLRGRD